MVWDMPERTLYNSMPNNDFIRQQRIMALLGAIPNISISKPVQQALILGASLDDPLLSQIQFSDPAQAFLQLLVPTLESYGHLEDGRHAIQAVLQSARNLIGPDKRPECDALLEAYHSAPVAEAAGLLPEHIDLQSLPNTDPLLFGRDTELQALDDAWDDERAAVVQLVAAGGVGKSALINRWLMDMEDDDFRGALRVYGWSFYNQGAAEASRRPPIVFWPTPCAGSATPTRTPAIRCIKPNGWPA